MSTVKEMNRELGMEELDRVVGGKTVPKPADFEWHEWDVLTYLVDDYMEAGCTWEELAQHLYERSDDPEKYVPAAKLIWDTYWE